MATYNQVNTVLNSLMSQYRGTAALTNTDLTGLISMGKTAISSSNDKEAFNGVLSDMIGKTILRYLRTTLEFPELSRDEYEFGGILRKIRIRPSQMKENTSVKIGAVGYTPDQFAINKPDYGVKYFTDFDSWADKLTVPDTLLKTAFRSAEDMGAFIDGLMANIGNNFTSHENLMAKTAITNYIAEKINAGNGVVNLRTMYNTQFGQSLTEGDCLVSQSFLQFAGMVIRNFKNYLNHQNSIYNVGHEVNETSDEEMLVYFLGDFVSAYNTYLLNGLSIFNDEFVKLPNYREVNTWQAGGSAANTAPTLSAALSNGSIDVVTSSGNTVTSSGIIGIIADRAGIATTSTDIYVATDRNNGDRYTNYTYGASNQYINDLDEQGIIFTIA